MSDMEEYLSESDRIGILNEKQQTILGYIDSKIDDVGYIKSKRISNNINNLSSKEVGSNMPIVSRESTRFIIEEWSTSAGNTWRVERK